MGSCQTPFALVASREVICSCETSPSRTRTLYCSRVELHQWAFSGNNHPPKLHGNQPLRRAAAAAFIWTLLSSSWMICVVRERRGREPVNDLNSCLARRPNSRSIDSLTVAVCLWRNAFGVRTAWMARRRNVRDSVNQSASRSNLYTAQENQEGLSFLICSVQTEVFEIGTRGTCEWGLHSSGILQIESRNGSTFEEDA